MKKEFATWLRANKSKFPLDLIRVKNLKNRSRYRFKGVPNVFVDISPCGLSIFVIYRNQNIEILFDEEIVLKVSSDGRYYCGLCKDNGYHRYYQTHNNICEAHLYKTLLKWVLKNLRKQNYLVIRRWGTSTDARILSLRSLRKELRENQKKKTAKENGDYIFKQLINPSGEVWEWL